MNSHSYMNKEVLLSYVTPSALSIATPPALPKAASKRLSHVKAQLPPHTLPTVANKHH